MAENKARQTKRQPPKANPELKFPEKMAGIRKLPGGIEGRQTFE